MKIYMRLKGILYSKIGKTWYVTLPGDGLKTEVKVTSPDAIDQLEQEFLIKFKSL